MPDSCPALTSKPWPASIVDAHHVNHSRKPTPELSRSTEVLANVYEKNTRAAIASTNLIDPTWRELKSEVPLKGAVTARTRRGRERLSEYIRAGQWKVMLSTYDRWGPFCEAASAYENDARDKLLCRDKGSQAKRSLHGKLSKMVLRGKVRDRRCKEGGTMGADSNCAGGGHAAMGVLTDGDAAPEQDFWAELIDTYMPRDDFQEANVLQPIRAPVLSIMGYELFGHSAGEGAVRLHNMGNTCYVNASLRALSCLPTVQAWSTQHKERCARDGVFVGCVLCSLAEDLSVLSTRSEELYTPRLSARRSQIRDHFNGFSQQCAYDCLQGVLGHSHEIDRADWESAGVSVEADVHYALPHWAIFGGVSSSTVVCRRCGYTCRKYERFTTLSLQLAAVKVPSLQSCLKLVPHGDT